MVQTAWHSSSSASESPRCSSPKTRASSPVPARRATSSPSWRGESRGRPSSARELVPQTQVARPERRRTGRGGTRPGRAGRWRGGPPGRRASGRRPGRSRLPLPGGPRPRRGASPPPAGRGRSSSWPGPRRRGCRRWRGGGARCALFRGTWPPRRITSRHALRRPAPRPAPPHPPPARPAGPRQPLPGQGPRQLLARRPDRHGHQRPDQRLRPRARHHPVQGGGAVAAHHLLVRQGEGHRADPHHLGARPERHGGEAGHAAARSRSSSAATSPARSGATTWPARPGPTASTGPWGSRRTRSFDRPIITPSTKAEYGKHDEPISEAEILGAEAGDRRSSGKEACAVAQRLFARGQEWAASRGLILVDTKYEMGLADGKLVVIDEIHTPDSSRYWLAREYLQRFMAGQEQQMLDKENIRQWLIKEHGFSGHGKPPGAHRRRARHAGAGSTSRSSSCSPARPSSRRAATCRCASSRT